MQIHILRLLPGTDLRGEIQKAVEEMKIAGGWMLTAVGSLSSANIRFADQENGTLLAGPFEIVSLTGTLSMNGSHLHISISGKDGIVVGGHLLEKNLVYTTAELVIGWDDAFTFTREHDGSTPWKELRIERRKQ